MRVYLIRHAQSANNALHDISQRTQDPVLTAKGEHQAELLADYLARPQPPQANTFADDIGLTHLYVSPMRRALQTALPIARALNLTPVVWPDVCEVGGIWLQTGEGQFTGYPGMSRKEISDLLPGAELPDTITVNGWWDAAQGKENRPQAAARAQRAAAALHNRAQTEPEARIGIVTHGSFLDRFVRALLRMPIPIDESYRWIFQHQNTGMSLLMLHPQYGEQLCYNNRTDHLANGNRHLRSW